MAKKISSQTEARVIALLARGDTVKEVQDNLKEAGTPISPLTVGNVRNRNKDIIDSIKGKLTKIELAKTEQLLVKSRQLIEKKLDASLDESVPPALQKLFDDGDIDQLEFNRRFENVMRARHIALKDLTTVSKEMFNQSQIEAGRPTSITNSPEVAKQQLDTLLRAIKNGKEEDIAKAIFLDA